MAIFISYPISTRDTHISPMAEGHRADMGVSGWYGVWYENRYIIIYLSYIFFLTRLPIWYRLQSQRQCRRVLSMRWYGFFARAKKPYHPRYLVTWWYGFFARTKKPFTHVIHYHAFCAPQEGYVLESHVSITYTKWTYFLVNVWQG